MPTAMNTSKLKRRESDTDVSSYYSEYNCTGSLGIESGEHPTHAG